MEASKQPFGRQTAACVQQRGVPAQEKEWQSPECPGKQAQVLLSIWREKKKEKKKGKLHFSEQLRSVDRLKRDMVGALHAMAQERGFWKAVYYLVRGMITLPISSPWL